MKKAMIFILLINNWVGLNFTIKLMAQETQMLYLMNQLDAHFYQAAIFFINFDNKNASKEVEMAIKLLNPATDIAKTAGSEKINGIVRELEILSKDLATFRAENIQRLKRSFARAHYFLAEYHVSQSTDYFDIGDYEGSVVYLQAASNYLLHGVKWVGHEVSKGTRSKRRAVFNLSNSIEMQYEINSKELGKSLGFFKNEIIRFGNKLGEQKSKYDLLKIENKPLDAKQSHKVFLDKSGCSV